MNLDHANLNHSEESDCDARYPSDSRVTFKRFQEIFLKIKEKTKSSLEVKVHWDQIRTILKGSVEAILQDNCLTLDQYLNEKIFPYKRVRLTVEERKDVYAVFQRYQAIQVVEKLWDDVDKVNELKIKRTIKIQPTLQPDIEKTCDILSIFGLITSG